MTVVNLAVSSFSTTGTITTGVGLNKIVVADASGFAVNDYLIVEIGGESGGGLRGTVGVGGLWPISHYANAAAMHADSSQPNNKFAYLDDTLDIWAYIWPGDPPDPVTAFWFQLNTIVGNYYVETIIPKALASKIIGKSGTTLTLQTPATVATTNANVYFDNAGIINATTAFGSGVADNSTIILPSGRFALSDAVGISGHNNWEFHGTSKTATTLFYPKGSPSGSNCMVGGSGVNTLSLHDFGMEGNTRAQGYMVCFIPGGGETQAFYNRGIQFATSVTGLVISDIKAVDCFSAVALGAGCDAPIVQRVEAILTEGMWSELWHTQVADCPNAQIIDCTIVAATWSPGFELFRCTGSSIVGCSSTNAFFAMNSDNDWLVQNVSVTINGADQGPHSIFASNSQIVDINKNIGATDVSSGGLMKNITVTQIGTIGAAQDVLHGIVVQANLPNVRLDGATITLPGFVAGSTTNGAVGFSSDGDYTSVKNLTCRGLTDPLTGPSSYGNVNFYFPSSTYYNLSVDTVKGGTQIFSVSFLRLGARFISN